MQPKTRNRCSHHGSIFSNYPNLHLCRLMWEIVDHLSTSQDGEKLDRMDLAMYTIDLVYKMIKKNKISILLEGRWYDQIAYDSDNFSVDSTIDDFLNDVNIRNNSPARNSGSFNMENTKEKMCDTV